MTGGHIGGLHQLLLGLNDQLYLLSYTLLVAHTCPEALN
jgi:hypothetical protein